MAVSVACRPVICNLFGKEEQLPYILDSKILDWQLFQKFHHIPTLVEWETWLVTFALQLRIRTVSSDFYRSKTIDA